MAGRIPITPEAYDIRMTIKNTKDEILTIRVSKRIRTRMEQVLDGQQMSEFVRLVILREVERRERIGRNGNA